MIQSNQKLGWWAKLAWQSYGYLPMGAEDVLKWCSRYILPFKGLRIPIVILRGPTRPDGHPGTLLVAGAEQGLDYMTSRFFDGDYQREIVDKVPLWNLARTLKHLRTSAELTIVRLDRLSARLFFDADYLAVPECVGSTLAVPEDLAKLTRGNTSLKSDLRIVRRNKLTPEVSKAEEDFDEFYYTMYVPFIRKRYGKQAVIRNVYWMRRAFSQGGLIWVRQDSQRISGVIFRRRGQVLQSLAMGTANGEWALLKAGADIATDLFIVKHAKKLGCKFIDFGGSRPSLNDGVLRYKRKWGINLIEKPDIWYDFLVHWNSFNGVVASFLSRTPLIFRDHDGLSAIYAIDHNDAKTRGEVQNIYRSMWMPGLRCLYLVSASGWKAVQDIPSKTVLIDLTAGRECNPRTLQALRGDNKRAQIEKRLF